MYTVWLKHDLFDRSRSKYLIVRGQNWSKNKGVPIFLKTVLDILPDEAKICMKPSFDIFVI